MIPDEDAADAALCGAALHEAKRALRAQVLAARDAMPAPRRAAAGAAIAARVAGLASFAAAQRVLLTLAFRSEWDTLPLAQAALAAGKDVALPRVDAQRRMLALHVVRDLAADVVPGPLGIREPRLHCETAVPGTIDWVLVPGVAFDAAGRRLGYGGGYYDRLLALLRPGTMRVAGAFELQIVPRVPAAAHDLAVDAIVTETRMIAAAGA
jgi:5-formyltetrahydrofolate cyclo-ligase